MGRFAVQHEAESLEAILNDYAFNAPGLRHLENVHRLRYIKWHYAMRHVVHMLLLRLRNRIAAIDQQESGN
jgi:hypothetical protein